MIGLTRGVKHCKDGTKSAFITDDETGENIFFGNHYRSTEEAQAELDAVMAAISHVAKRLNATIATTYEKEK